MARRGTLGAGLAILAALILALWQPWRAADVGGAQAHTIILLSIDALRRDHVAAFAPGGAPPRARMPNLDALARRSLRFSDARTPVPLTLPSHTCMLTGRMPAAHGVRINSQPLAAPGQRDFQLVPEALQAAGWTTAAFVSAETLHPRYGLGAGFDHYDAEGLVGARGALAVPERKGDATVAAAIRFVSRVDPEQPLFLFVHLFEPHFPYAPTYRDDCENADRVVGLLLEGLRRQARGSAAILVTADHGEALGELGELTHGILLSDSVMRVPLLVHVPGAASVTRTDPVTVADIAPTLAAIAGVRWTDAPGVLGGRSLLAAPFPADRPRVAESLYGHHRYRWAQLTATVRPDGQLVDVGADRAHWLPVQPFGEDLPGPLPATEAPDDPALYRTLTAYRSSQDPALMSPAHGISGYGAGGVVAPFLSGPENARLKDPHQLVSAADTLNALAAAVDRARATAMRAPAADRRGVAESQLSQVESAIKRLIRMAAVDQANPEISFRLGKAHYQASLLKGMLGRGATRHTKAGERASARAWQQGRHDEGTLVLWCGINAIGREAEMVTRLETQAQALGTWTYQLLRLKVILLHAQIKAGREDLGAAHAEACRAAKAAAPDTPQARKQLESAGCK